MRRYSIRTLMASIVLVAVGLAALKNASEVWAGMLLLLALAAIGVAALGTIIMRGRERCWWAGFALFGGAYLALAVAPWLGDAFRPRLGTTHLLGYLHARMFGSSPPALEDSEALTLILKEQELGAAIASTKRLLRNPNADPAVQAITKELAAIRRQLAANKSAAPRSEQFQSVGHSLFTLLAGLAGGTVGVGFSMRRERGGRDAEWSPRSPRRSEGGGEGDG